MLDNQAKPKSVFTTSYQYGDNNEEYVFACKGRPFAALISDILPTPDTNLIDHNLVRELGLKMTNLQCRKFHFAGHKMRVLGRVSTAVQCIQDGRTNGGIHLKGLVVTNLDQYLDTQVIVGSKMRGNIRKMSSKCVNERKCSTGDSDDVYADSDSDDSVLYFPSHWQMGQQESDDVYADSDSNDSVVSTQALEDSLLAPDSTTAEVMTSTTVSSSKTSSTTVSSSMMSSPAVSSSMMSSPAMVPLMVSSATRSSHVPPSSSITTSTATTSVTPAWVYPLLPGNPSQWYDKAEYRGKIIQQSIRDNKPRITNISHGSSNSKFRVGTWDPLDKANDESRHAVLADLRRVDPDRVCHLCSYLLRHKCPLTDHFGVMQHCRDCCNTANQLHLKLAAENYREALQKM